MKRVVVGTDGSKSAEGAVAWAMDLCRATGAELTVGAAWSPRLFNGAQPVAGTASNAGVVVTTVVVEEDPAITLAHLAEEDDADLVVVGNVAAPDEHRVLDSVREHLVHHLRCPLATVPEEWLPVAGGTVVVGADGSGASEVALRWAVDVAREVDGEVVVLFVHDPLADSFPHPDTDNWQYPGEEAVRKQVARVGQPADRIRLVQVAGAPDKALRRVADDADAAMIVVGTRGRGGLRGHVVGKVPMHLLHDAERPLVVVPHPH